MNKMEALKLSAAKVIGNKGFLLQKHSPEVLIGVGIVGIVASTVLACRATLKVNYILDEAESNLDKIKDVKEQVESGLIPQKNGAVVYTDKDYKKDIALVHVKKYGELTKLYAPAVTLGVAGVVCILSSHNIMRKRNIALMAAYKAIEQSFYNYRQRVIEEYGERKDYQYRNGIREIDVIEPAYTDEEGKKHKAGVKTVEVFDPTQRSQYARFFDESCANWCKTPEYNLAFVRCQQTFANDMLKARGHVFLNDVYDMLGMDRTREGAVVGWVISKEGDNFIDFGLYDVNNPGARRFVNGAEPSILLDFNVDGLIWDKI